MFIENPYNFFRSIYSLVRLGFDGNYLESLPPAEVQTYISLAIQEQREEEEARKNLDNANKMNIN